MRPRRGELQADFCFIANQRADKQDAALLLFPGAIVLQRDLSAPADASLQENERSVGVDGQSFRFFIKRKSTDIVSAYANGDPHDNALAATARDWKIGNFGL